MVARYRMKNRRGDYLTQDEVQRVLAAVDDLDAARARLWDALAQLTTVLAHEKRRELVKRVWRRFLASGGVTGDDWLDFVNGARWRGCVTWRKNLRVVADNTKRPRTNSRSRTGTGGSAA